MKKILALILAGLMLFSFAACGGNNDDNGGYNSIDPTKGTVADTNNKETVVVGYTIYEPMNYKDESGKLIGFDTELAEKVFGNLGYEVIFQEIEWSSKYT
ncbi:MAG: transporter substrate-binding domain-containing protein, partial [Clostridia bacterium]|nr:transporter substrate-binding domain-containing protein [Clostridia bacterium]